MTMLTAPSTPRGKAWLQPWTARGSRISRPPASCGFAHVGLCVPDLDRAIRWYLQALGCDVLSGPVELTADGSYAGRAAADVFGPGFGTVRMAHLTTASGVAIELFEFLDPPRVAQSEQTDYWDRGFSHICMIDRDIEARVAAITAAGGKMRTRRIWEVFPGEPYRFAHCEDPFGNIIEIYSHSHERVYANRQS